MLHSAPSHAVLKKVKTASHYNVPCRLSLLRYEMSVKIHPLHLHTSAHLHKDRQYLTTILLGRFSLSAIAEISLKAFIRLRSLAFICRAANKKYHLKFPEPNTAH